MTHLPHLIQDLGLILITAALVALLFKRLRQPVVLGYLISGILLSSHFPYFPTIRDRTDISIWAEIGVIFMLFSLGLEFNFKKLIQVGKSALVTALFQISTMMSSGYLVGQILGWSFMDSIFLGGMLSISSTAIIVRAFEELGLKSKNFVTFVYGILIAQDIFAILLIALLSTIAASSSFSGLALLQSTIHLGLFLMFFFLLGVYILPAFFEKNKRFMSDETTLIISLGLCLIMVVTATAIGFSPALGAFLMGFILGQTQEGKRIEHLLHPVKDLFSAIFFVSVGMLIDPLVISENINIILILTVVVILGQSFSTTIGSLVSGRSLKHSVQSGMSMAQIGEFSFVIATLGLALQVTSSVLYPIAVAVSILTTFLTPYMIKKSNYVFEWLDSRIPLATKERFSRYQITMLSTSKAGAISLFWKEYGIKILLNSVIVIVIVLLTKEWVFGQINLFLDNESLSSVISCLISLIFSSPFLWAVLKGGPSHSEVYQVETSSQLKNLQFGVSIIKFIIGSLLLVFTVSRFSSLVAFTGIILVLFLGITIFVLSRFSEKIYQQIENQFLSHLTANERAQLEKNKNIPTLAPWDGELFQLQVPQNSFFVKRTILEAKIKEKYGITIVMIQRGKKRMLAPNKDEMILPFDMLFLIGTDEQMNNIRNDLQDNEAILAPKEDIIEENLCLTMLTVSENSQLIGKEIRESGLRNAVGGLVVGVERNGKRYLSPDSNMQLEKFDLVWLVADSQKLKSFEQ